MDNLSFSKVEHPYDEVKTESKQDIKFVKSLSDFVEGIRGSTTIHDRLLQSRPLFHRSYACPRM